MAMKRFLLLLAVAVVGFVVAAYIYMLIEPYLPMLPSMALSLLPIFTSGWFIAGVIGAILAVLALVAWAYSGGW